MMLNTVRRITFEESDLDWLFDRGFREGWEAATLAAADLCRERGEGVVHSRTLEWLARDLERLDCRASTARPRRPASASGIPLIRKRP